MDDYRRRRRLDSPQEPKGGIPIVPLIVLVIFAGLLLGGGLAKFFGRGGGAQPTSAPTFTPLPSAELTASPSPTPSHKASPSPSMTPSSSPSPSASAHATPTASPKPSPTATPTASPTPKGVIIITPTPKATTKPSERPATPKPAPTPTETPTPALITGAVSADHAAGIVRSYLSALANGEESFSTGYLRSGLPNESFITKGSRIENVQATQTGNGSFNVTALIVSAAGTYNETFTLRNGPNGLQIVDHTPTRVP